MPRSLFASHSKDDEEHVGALETVLSRLGYKLYTDYFETDKELPHSKRLANKIRQSNGLLVFWGPNVEQRDHTKMWVGWEVGVATQAGKPIVILEDTDTPIDLPVPNLTDYVIFDTGDEDDLRELGDVFEEILSMRHNWNSVVDNELPEGYRKSVKADRLPCRECKQEYGLWMDARNRRIKCPACKNEAKYYPD